MLEAAYSGRQQQCTAAAGSFASIEPVPAKSTAVNKGIFDIETETQTNKARKNCVIDAKRQNEEQERENIFDQILW